MMLTANNQQRRALRLRRSLTQAQRVVAVSAVALGACASQSAEPKNTSAPATTPAPAVTLAPDSEFAPGLTLAEGTKFRITPWSASECEGSLAGRIITDRPSTAITIAQWTADCVNVRGLNGNFQRYHVRGDADDANLVTTKQVPAGTAYAYDLTYTECTNSCEDYEYRVVLVELDSPPRPDYPTVMIANQEQLSLDELLDMANAIRLT
jgi:hypothetical protein